MDIVNRNSVLVFITKDTSKIREILAPRNSCVLEQSLAEAILPVGSATIAHFHPKTEEIYYLLQGQALMCIEDELREISASDAVAIPAGKRHQIKNIGEIELIFLCCCVPAYSDEDTVFCDSIVD